MKLRSIISALAALVLLVPMLVSCGGTAELPPTSVAPTAAIDASPTSATGGEPTAAQPDAATATPPPDAPANPTATNPAGLTFPLKTPYQEYGVVAHLYYTDRERVLQLTQNAGFDWVRQQIVWKDTEGPTPGNYAWDELDPIVETVANYKRKLLVNVVQAPAFYTADGGHGLPQDPTKLGDFMEALANRYGNRIAAYEIWNEQNLARETGGRITMDDVGRYVEMVVECYKRIKAVVPEAYVLIGGPSSTGVTAEDTAIADQDYFRAMYSYKDGLIKDYFDVQGVHPGGAANPPETLFPESPSRIEGCTPAPDNCWNNDETHYFRHIETIRKIMEEYGLGDHQMWVTEYGWAMQNNTPGYEFGNYVTPEQQAEYIAGAISLSREKYQPWLGNIFLWNMNFAVLWGGQGNPEHEQASFGILNPDWSPRPSFNAIQGLLAAIKEEEGRE